MLESLMLGKRTLSKLLVDIDFTAASVGDRVINDRGSYGASYTRSVMGGSPTDGVVDVPGKGKAYYFDGGTKFTADRFPTIYDKPYRITAAIMAGAKSGTIAASGAYPDAVGLRSGYALHSGQYANAYVQHFIAGPGGAYNRILLDGYVPANAIDNIVVTRFADGRFRIESTSRGVVNEYGTPSFSPIDSYFIVGGTHSNDNFQGHLFSLKIELL